MATAEPPFTLSVGSETRRTVEHDGCVFETYTLLSVASECRGRVLIVHGYRDRYELYIPVCEALIRAGYDVLFYYQRGEGRTVLKNGSRGDNSDKTTYTDLDFFVKSSLDELAAQLKPPKLFLLGHSMGGGIILNYAVIGAHRDKLAAIVASAPLIVLHPDTGVSAPTEWALRFACSCVPFAKNIRISTPLNVDNLASDQKILDYLENSSTPESLTGTLLEARDFVLRGRKLLKPEYNSAIDKELPILICHGDNDHVNDYKASETFISQLNSNEGMHNKSFYKVPGEKHTLLADHSKDEVNKHIVEFFDKFAE